MYEVVIIRWMVKQKGNNIMTMKKRKKKRRKSKYTWKRNSDKDMSVENKNPKIIGRKLL